MIIKSHITGYWVSLLILLGLQVFFQIIRIDTLMVASILILYAIAVIGYFIEVEQFVSYYKKNYPSEYNKMLKEKRRFKAQFDFSPQGDNLIKKRQKRLKNYFIFIIGVFILPPLSILLCAVVLN